MSYNTKELLALPNKEKRALAKKLWQSLEGSSAISSEEKEVIAMLEKRRNEIKSGKAVLLSPDELRKQIQAYRNKRK
jgi:putative addiction module component (TIGR02574 family)